MATHTGKITGLKGGDARVEFIESFSTSSGRGPTEMLKFAGLQETRLGAKVHVEVLVTAKMRRALVLACLRGMDPEERARLLLDSYEEDRRRAAEEAGRVCATESA